MTDILSIFKTLDKTLIESSLDYIKEKYVDVDINFCEDFDSPLYHLLLIGNLALIKRMIREFGLDLKKFRLRDEMIIYLPYSRFMEGEYITDSEKYRDFFLVGDCTFSESKPERAFPGQKIDYKTYEIDYNFDYLGEKYTIKIRRNFEEVLNLFYRWFPHNENVEIKPNFLKSPIEKLIKDKKYKTLTELIKLGLFINHPYISDNNVMWNLMKSLSNNKNKSLENNEALLELINVILSNVDKMPNLPSKFYDNDVNSDNFNEFVKHFEIVKDKPNKEDILKEDYNIHKFIKVEHGEHISLLTFALQEDNYLLAENLIQRGVLIDNLDSQGNTALYQMMLHNNLKAVEFLLDHGASFNTFHRDFYIHGCHAVEEHKTKLCYIFEEYFGDFSGYKTILSKIKDDEDESDEDEDESDEDEDESDEDEDESDENSVRSSSVASNTFYREVNRSDSESD